MKRNSFLLIPALWLMSCQGSGEHSEAQKRDSTSAAMAINQETKMSEVPVMVTVAGGTFTMGRENDSGEIGFGSKRMKVQGFRISKYETTVGQFRRFVEATHYITEAEQRGMSAVWDGVAFRERKGVTWTCNAAGDRRQANEDGHPVMHVSWSDAVAYCEWLSQKKGVTYRLPTEQEWEYAARGGANSEKFDYSGSNNLNEIAWWKANANSTTHPVGQKKPNKLGLYDMTGNVWEWCSDKYADEEAKPNNESAAAREIGYNRLLRGGSLRDTSIYCEVTSRNIGYPVHRYIIAGFRVAAD
jgi:formylglycine-generating enzyme